MTSGESEEQKEKANAEEGKGKNTAPAPVEKSKVIGKDGKYTMADLRSIRGKKTDSTNDDNNSQNDKQENDEKNNSKTTKMKFLVDWDFTVDDPASREGQFRKEDLIILVVQEHKVMEEDHQVAEVVFIAKILACRLKLQIKEN